MDRSSWICAVVLLLCIAVTVSGDENGRLAQQVSGTAAVLIMGVVAAALALDVLVAVRPGDSPFLAAPQQM